MSNKDKEMLAVCVSDQTAALFKGCSSENHPLDKDVVEKITKLHDSLRDDDDDFEIFRHSGKTDDLWDMLLSKAIKCLRYYDTREPFIKSNDKKPKAYGLDDLKKYFDKYKEFERMLYGSSKYYRDHVVHVFRTWLSGIVQMVKNDGDYLSLIGISEEKVKLDVAEKISIWTIIALTHDLGYPLEKAKGIIDTTKSMVSTFVSNPNISMDLSFHGVQNHMNDYIIRLMSSKMVKRDKNSGAYFARLQSKYYFKFQKSLEKTDHGIVSTLIIYKLLNYFLESDFNINEDYTFNREERRQFYIRREILRAIASHTCTDVYHLNIGTFAFLLIIADDMQEWGRKYITELYKPSGNEYVPGEIDIKEVKNKTPSAKSLYNCRITEKMSIGDNKDTNGVISLVSRLKKQSMTYVAIFRDGQDTVKRNFSFERVYTIICGDIAFEMKLKINRDCASCLDGSIVYSTDKNNNGLFGEKFVGELEKELKTSVEWEVFSDEARINAVSKDAPKDWRAGTLNIILPDEF